MIKFICGVVFGIVVTTVGFSGLAAWADKGVAKVQAMSKDAANSDVADEAVKTTKKAVAEITK